MNLKDLTERLIAADKSAERRRLLETVAESDFLRVAQALRDTYYESWTSAPERVPKAARALGTLFKLQPIEEIRALSLWVSGIARLTQGKFDAAVNSLESAAEIFQSLDKEYESAQTQVAKLYALALLGRYDEALHSGRRALRIFAAHKDELAAGKIEKNIGNIFWRRDLYKEAEKRFLSARARFEKIGNFEELTMVEHCLATVNASQNEFRRAEKFYSQALRHAGEAGMSVTEAEIEASLGNLALFRGRYDEALKFLEESRRKYEILNMPHQTAIAELELAEAYLELNLNRESVLIYRKVAALFRKLNLRGEEARARASLGRAAVALNESAAARRELKKAARIYLAEKNSVGAAFVKLNAAQLEFDLKNYRRVCRLTDEAETLLEGAENTRDLLSVRWLRAEAERELGETEAAREILERVFADSVEREQPQTAQAAQISLGKIAAAGQDFKRAKTHFRRAIRLIETLRAPLAAEEFRMAFLANKLAPFERLARIHLAENNFKAAFLIVEKARSRSLAESLNGAPPAISGAQNKVSAKLIAESENLREELNWFYSRLRRADDAEIKNLQAAAAEREKRIADVQRQIASTSEAAAGAAFFLEFEELQNRLGEKSAFVEFVNFDGIVSAFVVTDRKIHFVENLAMESEILVLLENLHFQFGSLRYGAAALNSFMPELKKRAVFYLESLYQKLLAPLENLTRRRDLIVVPVGALHYVPFHALFDGDKYQIETREIVYAPSATIWQLLASKPRRKLKTALFIGYADEQIPLVEREIESLRNVFSGSEQYVGAQATFAAFTQNAPRFDVVHLACHGRFRPENPLFSSLHLADGFVTVKDACAQRLKAEIVVLSACETGLNRIHAGDEILGLARGFLAAGAKSLILSLWTVSDAATLDLMKSFYAELQTGKTAAAALRIAQRELIGRGLHPYFWSPFALIGR